MLSLIAADKAGIPLDYNRACAIDLACKGTSKTVLEAVRTSINPKVIDCPHPDMGRGGKIDARATVTGEQGRFVITCTGQNARIPHGVEELIAGRSEAGTIDAHAVQPFYTGMIARAAGMNVAFGLTDGVVTITSEKRGEHEQDAVAAV